MSFKVNKQATSNHLKSLAVTSYITRKMGEEAKSSSAAIFILLSQMYPTI